MSREIDPEKDLDEYTTEELQYALARDWFEDEETARKVSDHLASLSEDGEEDNEDGLMDESVPDLRQTAEDEGIDLAGAKRKKDIVKLIRVARTAAE
jgi:hypothetical protein